MGLRQTRNGTRALAGLVLAVAALSVAGWLAVRWLGGSSVSPDEVTAVAAAFLDDVRGGRIDSAWAATTAEFKSFMGRDRLQRFVRTHPVLREAAECSQFQIVSINGLSMAECLFRPTSGNSAIRVLVRQEESRWKVERLEVE